MTESTPATPADPGPPTGDDRAQPPDASTPDAPLAAREVAREAASGDVVTTAPDGDAPGRTVLAPAGPHDDLRVAHVLLRNGNALPARVHLETLAGRHQLNAQGLLDLAESRWRTGDPAGAGEAVAAYVGAGGEEPLGFLIAAETASLAGRPGEARKLARRALETLDQPLDAVFAGQPRSGLWPHDPAAPAQPVATLFAAQPASAARGGRIGLTSDPPSTNRTGPSPTPVPHATAAEQARVDAEPGPLPPLPAEVRPERSIWEQAPERVPAAQSELDAARAILEAGDPRGAVVRLSIVLRTSPALAPAVLELVGQLPGPDFDLLRGDALRLVGHEAAAERAFASAADALRNPAPRSPE